MYSTIFKTISILTLLFFAACKEAAKQEPVTHEDHTDKVTLTAEQLTHLKIKTDTLRQQSMANTIRLTGRVEVPPQNMVSISVPMGGYLIDTKLLPGMHVFKNEIIARVEDRVYIQLQEDYLLTKEKIKLADAEYQRQKLLNEAKAASDKVFQQAETEYKSLTIVLASLREKLKLINIDAENLTANKISKTINIYAPIDGFVTSVNYNIGKYISSSEVLFELVNPEDIHLALEVFERDVDKLVIGQKLEAYTNNNPHQKYVCEIIAIGKDFSKERTVAVHCHFEKYDKNLLPNIFMNADLIINEESAYTLPSDAIVSFDEKNYVFVKQTENLFKLTQVNIGYEKQNKTQIKNYADLINQLIVTEGSYSLLMALKNSTEE